MPFIEIMMVEGRNSADKQRLLEAVTLAAHEALDMPLSGIRAWIKEVPRDAFLPGEALAASGAPAAGLGGGSVTSAAREPAEEGQD